MDRTRAAAPAEAFEISWAASTAQGSRSRHQDRHGVRVDEPCVLVLADGLGGHPAGDRAAEIAVRAFLTADRDLRGARLLEEGVQGALSRLAAAVAEDPACEGLGSTVVAATLEGEVLHHLHAGDSRLYLFRTGQLRLLTFPDELTEKLREEGVLRPEEALASPLRGRLTAWLGMPEPRISRGSVMLEDGDRIALLSDGALEGGEDRLAALLATEDPEAAARQMVHGVPTEDNATAVVARFHRRRHDAE